jgi:hypothetical protein
MELQMATRSPLIEWIVGLRERFGTYRAMAEGLGMTESGFLRGAKRGTLSVENLLGLSHLVGERPDTVLRLADKSEAADLLLRLYGPGRESLTARQQEILALWDYVKDDRVRCEALLFTMRTFAEAARLTAPTASQTHGASASARGPLPAPRVTARAKRRGRGRSL